MSRNIRAYLIPSEDHRRLNEFIGLLLATIAVLVGLSLISFNPDDPSFTISRNPEFPDKAHNFIGTLGAYVSDLFLQLLGFASFLVPVVLGIYAFYWLTSRKVDSIGARATGYILMTFTIAAALSVPSVMPFFRGEIPPGGVIGRLLADKLDETVSTIGSILLLASSLLISLFLATTFSFSFFNDLLYD